MRVPRFPMISIAECKKSLPSHAHFSEDKIEAIRQDIYSIAHIFVRALKDNPTFFRHNRRQTEAPLPSEKGSDYVIVVNSDWDASEIVKECNRGAPVPLANRTVPGFVEFDYFELLLMGAVVVRRCGSICKTLR